MRQHAPCTVVLQGADCKGDHPSITGRSGHVAVQGKFLRLTFSAGFVHQKGICLDLLPVWVDTEPGLRWGHGQLAAIDMNRRGRAVVEMLDKERVLEVRAVEADIKDLNPPGISYGGSPAYWAIRCHSAISTKDSASRLGPEAEDRRSRIKISCSVPTARAKPTPVRGDALATARQQDAAALYSLCLPGAIYVIRLNGLTCSATLSLSTLPETCISVSPKSTS